MAWMDSNRFRLNRRIEDAYELRKTACGCKEKIDELKTSDDEQFNDKINKLQRQLNDFISKIGDFINIFTDMKAENECNAKEMKRLSKHVKSKEKELDVKFEAQKLEIQELKRQIEVLEEEKRILGLGQVTWLFEQYVATFVLPETEKVGLMGCFKHMNKWLGKHVHTPEGMESQKIWLDLQCNSKVVWSADHWDAIKDLREARKPMAHPKVNFAQAKQEISATIPNLKDECLDIIYMVDKLNSLMVLGKLAHGFQDMVINVVYPGAKMDIAQLMKWIEDNGASEQGKEKRERWSKLSNEMEWTQNHEKALDKMKLLKRDIKDLQEIEFEKAKMHMVDYVPKNLEQECFDIVDIMKKIMVI